MFACTYINEPTQTRHSSVSKKPHRSSKKHVICTYLLLRTLCEHSYVTELSTYIKKLTISYYLFRLPAVQKIYDTSIMEFSVAYLWGKLTGLFIFCKFIFLYFLVKKIINVVESPTFR